MFKKNSIFSRMFLSYAFIIVLSFLLFIGVFFYLFHLHLYDEYDAIYQHHYLQVEEQLNHQQQFNWSEREVAEVLGNTLHQPGYHIYLLDETGKLIFGPKLDQNDLFIPIPDNILKQIQLGDVVAEGSIEDGQLRYTIANKLNTEINEVDQPIMVMIFHQLGHEYQRVIWMILLTFLIAIIFAGIIIWFMSKKITAPLRDMSEIAKDYAKGNFSKTVQYELNDEIGQLAKSFNNMAKELNDLETTRKQYISNVSHELRSPLTSIKGFIIALMDGTIPNNRQHYYFRLMKDETERMIKLVNDTLDMNRLEEGHQQILRTKYNLTEQINTIIDKFEPHLQDKNIQIRLHADRHFKVYADKERIEQVIVNLIHNAIQFSNKNTYIDIKLIEEGQYVNVKITDYGIGIEDHQLDLIWRRFYKADEARSSKSGAGLGLAIVKSILDLHETDVNVETKPGKGSTFSFKLPIS